MLPRHFFRSLTLAVVLAAACCAAQSTAVTPSTPSPPSSSAVVNVNSNANVFLPPSISFPDGNWCLLYPCVADFAVIGTGPAGSTAAATLARELPTASIRSVTDGTAYAVEQTYSWTWFWNDTQVLPPHIKDIPYNRPHWTTETVPGAVATSQYWPQCQVKQGCQDFNGGVCQSVSDAYWDECARLVNDPFFAAANVNRVATWYERYIGVADPTHRHGTTGGVVMREFAAEPLWHAAVTSAVSGSGDCPTLADTNSGTYGVGNAARNVDVLPNYAPQRQTAYDKLWAPLLADGTGRHTEVSLATVTRLLWHPLVPNRCIGYTYVKDGRSVDEYVRHEVILATGNLQDPKLLFLSGVGPKAQLAALNIPLVYDSPQLGRNLMNEVVWNFEVEVPFNEPRHNGSGMIATWRSARAIARGEPLADCMLTFVRYMPVSPTATLAVFGAELLRYDSRGSSVPLSASYDQEFSTQFAIFSDTQNPAGSQDIDVAVEIHLRARTVIAAVGGYEIAPGLAAVPNNAAAIKAWLPGAVDTNYHHHGSLRGTATPTAATATAAAAGVLDSNFNVIGTRGVRVVSNAWAPVQHDAHASQHTSMRLGALAGLKIASDYQ